MTFHPVMSIDEVLALALEPEQESSTGRKYPYMEGNRPVGSDGATG
jgi:hypothetical protein